MLCLSGSCHGNLTQLESSSQTLTSARVLKKSVEVTAASTSSARTAASVHLDITSTASLGPVKVSCCLPFNKLNPQKKKKIQLFTFLTIFKLCVLDINECRHYPGRLCAHKCENILGSYKCTCTNGFKLSSDGRNCDGKELLCLYIRRKYNSSHWPATIFPLCRYERVREQSLQSRVCQRVRVLPMLLSPWLPAQWHRWHHLRR